MDHHRRSIGLLRTRIRPGAGAVARRRPLQGARLRRPLSASDARHRRRQGTAARRARESCGGCGINPAGLTMLVRDRPGASPARCRSQPRVLEVAIHKAHALHFALENILDGTGTGADRAAGSGFRQGDGTHERRHHLRRPHPSVRQGSDDATPRGLPTACRRARASTYGKPFAEIFAAVNGDFYKIDPMLFSPAQVIVSNVETGNSFRAGELAPEIVDASFR